MATAVQVESIWNGLTDNSGEPLASGKVYTYYAGTSTPVALFTASDKSTSATNPLILDGNGKAQVWADGRYKFVVKTAADVTLYTLDNLLYGFDDSTVLWGGQSTGSANAQTVSVPATVGVYANGQRVSFIAGYTNSGAVTLRFNSLAPVSVVKGPNAVALQAGDIVVGQLVDCVYEAYSGTGRFRLENYPTLGDVQRSRFQVATNVSANSATVTADLTPALTSYEAGLAVRLKIVTTSSGPVTLNLNGLGAKAVQFNNAALVAGELQANYWHELVYDGTQFQLLNPYEVAITRWGGTSAGTSTAYTISSSPAITAYAAGQRFMFIAHAANGAAATLAINGLTATTIQRQGTALAGNEFKANDIIEVVYNGTNFQIVNVASAPLFVDRGNDRVGVGTTAPATVLDVSTGTLGARFRGANPLVNLQNTSTTSNDGGVLRFDHDQTSAKPLAEIRGQLFDGSVANRAGGLAFFTSTQATGTLTQKMFLSEGGNLGIGATAPTSSLCVAGGAQTVPSLAAVHAGTSGSYSLMHLANVNGGYIDFGPTGVDYAGRIIFNNSTNAFQVIAISNGVQLSSGGTSWAAISDIRFKKNIQPLDHGLDCILSLEPIRFDYLEEDVEGSKRIGFTAQNVKETIPEAVSGDESDRLFLSQTEIIPVLANAIKELNAKVESLESRIAALEA